MNLPSRDGLLEALFTNAREALLVCSTEDGLILRANIVCCDWLGQPLEVLQKQSLFERVQADSLQTQHDFQNAIQFGEPWESEQGCYLIPESGSSIPIGLRVIPIFEDDATEVLISIRPSRVVGLDPLQKPEILHYLDFLVQENNEGAMIFESADRITYYSASVHRILGYSAHEFEHEPKWNLIHPDDRDFVAEKLQELMNHPGQTIQYRARVQHADGSWRTLQSVATNRRDDPLIAGIVIHFRDITAQEQAEQALQQSEQRYRYLFEQTVAGVFRIRTDGLVLECNDAYARILGYRQAKDLENQLIQPHSFDLKEREEKLRELQARGRLTNYINRYRRRDGKEIWTLEHFFLNAAKAGELATIEGLVIDITDQKMAEAELAHQHTLLKALIDSIPDFIFFKDRNGRYLGCNKAFETYCGLKEDQLVGHTSAEIFTPERAGWLDKEDSQVYQQRQPLRLEKWLTNPTGRRLVEIVLTPLFSHPDRILGILGIGRDITDRHRMEEQIRQAGKMQAIGQLAGGIAHDFNNLLTIILGNLSLARTLLPSNHSLHEILQSAEHAGERAAEVTRQLLGFARRSPLMLQPVDLNSIIADTVKLLRHTLNPKIQLETSFASAVWKVEADRGQMSQILLNLCLNARDAMPNGGRLRIETSNIVLMESTVRHSLEARSGEFVLLQVSDTGSGIPPEIRTRIFEPFFTTKALGQGTGLGLSMVQGIVHQHHGWIDCYSETEHGTRFDIYLPRSTQEIIADFAAGPISLQGKETVLLADDEPMIRDLGRAALQQHGYKVILAENGVDAVEIYKRRQTEIQLVILDLTMPLMSGQEAFRRLREINPQVAVLFASGYSGDSLQDSDLKLVRGFLHKPFRPHELVKAVRESLDTEGHQ